MQAVANPAREGRTYEDFVLRHLIEPLQIPHTNPVDVHGFKVDIGLTGTPVVVECKNRLDSHQSHRAAAVAWALRSFGWQGIYVIVGPELPNEDTTDRMVLDCALTSGAVSHLLLTGYDPTQARIGLASILARL